MINDSLPDWCVRLSFSRLRVYTCSDFRSISNCELGYKNNIQTTPSTSRLAIKTVSFKFRHFDSYKWARVHCENVDKKKRIHQTASDFHQAKTDFMHTTARYSCCVNCTPKSDPINRCHVSFNRNKMLMSDFQLEIYRYSQCIKIKRLERPGTLMAKHCVQYEYQMKHKQLKLSQSCKKTHKKGKHI